MHRTVRNRATWAIFAVLLLVGAAVVAARMTGGDRVSATGDKFAARNFEESSQGVENGGSGGEAAEALTAAQQWADARTAPGIVAPGAYGAAFNALTSLPQTAGSWTDVTRVKYDADDINYRDYYSNSSGGAGQVTGRVVGLAADNAGHVYAAGANGGVWRSATGGGNWVPIADAIPSLSSGDLQLDSANNALWYATGEANTGGTSYAGSGVYRLSDPANAGSLYTQANRVGGNELESTTINAIRFSSTKVWIATLRGVWSHSRTGDMTTPWTLSLVPNPGYLPASLQSYLQDPSITLGGANQNPTTTNTAYKNIVNDLAIDPKNPAHLIAAVGWRSGDTYNGFYETFDNGAHWTKVNPTGAINPKDIGNATFAMSADGKKLYVMNQSPQLLNKLTGTVNSYLDGIYVSNNGSPAGPWSKIAESQKLANSGSALKQSIGGKGYGPGIQAWYNQFLVVDPANADHLWAGLEEIYESTNGGSTWKTVGPYWNFYFPCWAPDAVYPTSGVGNRCPLSTHSDQHAAAIGTVGGTPTLFVGNDGGVYKRPVNGQTNGNGNATDWTTLNDGTMDALQYYAVGVGTAVAGDANAPTYGGENMLVSGGLQDNGGSILRPGASKMSSNFGGDGGDVLVDPNNGCNIVQEYVVLAMRVTNKCAHQDTLDAFLDVTKSNTRSIAPPDINARFIAPFTANDKNINEWLAGGNSVWYQSQGFAIPNSGAWAKVKTWDNPTKVTTALAFSGTTAVAAWCGGPTCNNAGFNRGVWVATHTGSTWTTVTESSSGLPNRYVGGAAVDGSDVYVVMNGFSRRFTEGPGAGEGHVFKWNSATSHWDSIDGNFPDVPANSIKALPNHSLVVGTDLGVLYKAAGSSDWVRLGGNGADVDFPTTVAIDVELGPDGNLYVATHGRGIWRIAAPADSLVAGTSTAAGIAGGTAGTTGGSTSTPPAQGGKGKGGSNGKATGQSKTG